MSVAIDSGECSTSLTKSTPGKLVHLRWLRTGNRILTLCVASENPTENLVTLTTFVLKVYARVRFRIKTEPSCINGSRHLCNLIVLSRYLPEELCKKYSQNKISIPFFPMFFLLFFVIVLMAVQDIELKMRAVLKFKLSYFRSTLLYISIIF